MDTVEILYFINLNLSDMINNNAKHNEIVFKNDFKGACDDKTQVLYNYTYVGRLSTKVIDIVIVTSEIV